MPVQLLVPLVATLGPYAVAGIKKLLGTDKFAPGAPRKIIHKTIPLAVGLIASAVNCVAECSGDACGGAAIWAECAMAGLAAGAGMTYVRDFDKNVLGVGQGLARIFGKKG